MLSKSMVRLLAGLLIGAIAVAALIGWPYYRSVYIDGVPANIQEPFVQIPGGSSFDDVVRILSRHGAINNEASFRWLSAKMQYAKPVMRAGRFELKPGWSNRDLIRHLRGGEQAPVKFVLSNERLLEDIAGKAARFLEADSISFLQTLRDPAVMQEVDLTPETMISLFIPNTYEMYWNTDPKKFVQRMHREHKAFWDKNDRRKKAEAQGLTPTEAYTLASIVERESNVQAEKPRIAGTYLNRLRIGMRLQADPTCVFATRDFAATRVTEYHTTYDSPYNTYLYKGLPPGPICMSSIPSIEAVLTPETHEYLFFCAKPDDSGSHAFAETYAGHLVNVAKFRAYMQQRGY